MKNGNVRDGFDYKHITELMNGAMRLFQEKCLHCEIARLCTVCYGYLFDDNGKLLSSIPSEVCKQMKSETKRMLELLLVDTIFRTSENRKYCSEHGIHLNGPRLGRPSKDEKTRKEEELIEWLESDERGDIERRFGICKRCYSLGRVTTKLKNTSEVVIYLSVLTLNLQKRLRSLLRFLLSKLRRFAMA